MYVSLQSNHQKRRTHVHEMQLRTQVYRNWCNSHPNNKTCSAHIKCVKCSTITSCCYKVDGHHLAMAPSNLWKEKMDNLKMDGRLFWKEKKRTRINFRRAALFSMLKSRVGNIMAKASALRVNLNLDGAPIASSSHTHPSHSHTSRLLTLPLSLGVPVPRPTQCIRDV